MNIEDCNKHGLNSTRPDKPVKLAFIHHSCGTFWLADDNGGLGKALSDNNYFVSSTNYGWGPDSIGDLTDTGHWWSWFRGPDSFKYMNAVYNLNEKNCGYTRDEDIPTGENEIIMFKSCYPNSAVSGGVTDKIPDIDENPLKGKSHKSGFHTMGNIKSIYIDILKYFETRQDKLFILVTPPPLQNGALAKNARELNNWLVYDWLKDYRYPNVAVFDFFNILTGAGNHHRYANGKIEHMVNPGSDTLKYITEPDDDHPSKEGNIKATEEFTGLLNVHYNLWKSARPEA